MRDVIDLGVRGIIAAGILGCGVVAVVVPDSPLPARARTYWSSAATQNGRHVEQQTFAVDATTIGDRETPFARTAIVAPPGAAVAVRGWAFDPGTRRTADRLLYRVDEGAWRPAEYHLPRPDVAAAFNLPAAADAGFRIAVSGTDLKRGRHAIAFATVSGDQNPVVAPRRIIVIVRDR